MNKTLAQLFVGIIAVALITSQFWSCSTGQHITLVTTQIESDVDVTEGEIVLLFKLLTPMMPDDGQHISRSNNTDAKDSDKKTSLAVISAFTKELTYLEALNFEQNVSPYSFNDDKTYTQRYVFSKTSRGPPSYSL